MTEQQPITLPTLDPPKELVQEWISRWLNGDISEPYPDWFAARSAEWGADQELEACIHWLITGPYGASIACHADHMIADLRAARRPKPQPELTDEQLIAAAEQAGLCYPACWDLRGNDAPRLHRLRDFARAIAAELRGQEAQAQPEPRGLTDEEIANEARKYLVNEYALPAEITYLLDPDNPEYEATIGCFRAVLDRWGGSAPCPYVVSSDEGTSYCRLAEHTADQLAKLLDEGGG
jgi:hypothetical protein